MSATSIEWATDTWNPTTGCDRVSAGCDNCYALTMARRLKAMGQPAYQRDGDQRTSGPGFGLTVHPDRLDQPLRWRKPRRIFVNSMSDLFHRDVPNEFILRVWETMSRCPQHTFQILTKRPQRMAKLVGRTCWDEWSDATGGKPYLDEADGYWEPKVSVGEKPLPNVWLGVSVENQRYADLRIQHLAATPAVVRFLSVEPLLGPVDLKLCGRWQDDPRAGAIDWVIAGGESGPGARPMHPDWVRSIRDQCVAAGVPFLFKQWGGRTPKANGRHLDGRTWDEYPA